MTRRRTAPDGVADMRAVEAGLIRSALQVAGGHLFIGGGGWQLHFGHGATLRGYDLSEMKARCIDAGLPVIDILYGPHRLCLPFPSSPPMVAVGRPPDPQPWTSCSNVPLAHAAAFYRAAGAEVLNLGQDGTDAPEPLGRCVAPGPFGTGR